MTKTYSTKKALIASVLSLALCFSMLVGTTFAWFTDSATSAGNKVVAGTLDVQLLMDADVDGTYENIGDSASPIFGEGSIAQNNNAATLWEPGKTQVAYLAIKNNGNLDLKYTVGLNVQNVSKDLYKVMEYAIVPDADANNKVTAWNGGNSVVVGTQSVSGGVELKVGETHYFALAIHMDEQAGNEYKGGQVNFDLTVLASQLTSESDAFDNQYDAMATIDTVDELKAALAADYDLITLGADITLSETLTIPSGKTVAIDLSGYAIRQDKECTASYSMISNSGNLTILDTVGSGRITLNDTGANSGSSWGTYTIRNDGTLVVENGTIENIGPNSSGNVNNAIFSYAGSTTIKGGTFNVPYSRSVRQWHGTLTIEGGTFDGQVWVQAMADVTTTISGGSFKPASHGNDGSSVFVTNDAHDVALSVTGGTFATRLGMTVPEKCVTGGTFGTIADSMVADNYSVFNNGDGTYTVVNLKADVVKIFGLTLIPNGENSKIIVNDEEGFLNLTKLFNNWTALFTDGNGTTYTNYANGAGVDYYYASRWTISLEADIDLNNATIDPVTITFPVSTSDLTFDGNGHTIKNAKIVTDAATENEAGLFKLVYNTTMKNLKLDNIHVTGSNVGNSTAGVLAGSCNAGVSNITITNSSVTGGKYTGGVVGYGYTDVLNCTLTNVTVKGGYKLGGLIGYICASNGQTHDVTGNTLTNCTVDGIGGGIYAGGKTEYVIGKVVGNYNCNGTCNNNSITMIFA